MGSHTSHWWYKTACDEVGGTAVYSGQKISRQDRFCFHHSKCPSTIQGTQPCLGVGHRGEMGAEPRGHRELARQPQLGAGPYPRDQAEAGHAHTRAHTCLHTHTQALALGTQKRGSCADYSWSALKTATSRKRHSGPATATSPGLEWQGNQKRGTTERRRLRLTGARVQKKVARMTRRRSRSTVFIQDFTVKGSERFMGKEEAVGRGQWWRRTLHLPLDHQDDELVSRTQAQVPWKAIRRDPRCRAPRGSSRSHQRTPLGPECSGGPEGLGPQSATF